MEALGELLQRNCGAYWCEVLTRAKKTISSNVSLTGTFDDDVLVPIAEWLIHVTNSVWRFKSVSRVLWMREQHCPAIVRLSLQEAVKAESASNSALPKAWQMSSKENPGDSQVT